MNAVDTNVYVYALDTDESLKQAKALALFHRLALQSHDSILLWQVAGELLNQLRRWESKGKLLAEGVEAAFNRLRSLFPLRLPTERILQISFDLRSRYTLSHWDSMLLAACIESGVTTLYSEDMAAGMNYDGVTIVNPFA
jgi:predicted nucleic acid-binding protein